MRVLIADDDRACAELLAAQVTAWGGEVAGVVTSGGLAVIQKNHVLRPDVVLVDMKMQQFNGLTVCRTILSRYPKEKVILVSGSTDVEPMAVKSCGAHAFLAKPWGSRRLRSLLDELAAGFEPEPAIAVAAV